MLSKSKGIKRFPIVIVENPHYQYPTNNRSINGDDNMDVDSYDDDVSDASDDDYREEGEGSRSRMRNQRSQEDQEDQKDQEDQEDQEDPIPDFTMLGRRGNHKPKAQLDQVDDLSPAGIFRTFFNGAILETIIQNTNAYAFSKGAGTGNKRPWVDLVEKELLIFLSILIYHGLYITNALEDLWNMDPQAPIHWIAQKMTLMRFQQIKRYLHISELYTDNHPYYAKVSFNN